MTTQPADHYDRLLEDAEFDEFGMAELGPYSLRRDEVGFVTVIEWVDNHEVVSAVRKAP